MEAFNNMFFDGVSGDTKLAAYLFMRHSFEPAEPEYLLTLGRHQVDASVDDVVRLFISELLIRRGRPLDDVFRRLDNIQATLFSQS